MGQVFDYNVKTGETKVIEVESDPVNNCFLIDNLKRQLTETDYKIIKCSEYQLAGLELPYDIAELHTERQELRNKISELESV